MGSFLTETLDAKVISVIFLGSSAALLLYLIFCSLYASQATPLRKVPGPVLAQFTKWWMIMKTRERNRHVYDLEMHKKYGSVVRIGPTYVSVSSPEALKTIYGAGSGYVKDSWYDITGPAPKDGLDFLCETNMEKYRIQRRLMGPIYSAQQVKDLEPLLDKTVKSDVQSMRGSAGIPKSVDLWFNYLALDSLSALTFSTPYGLVEKGEDDGSVISVHSFWYFVHWAGFVPDLAKIIRFVSAAVARWKISTPEDLDEKGMFAWGLSNLEARKQGEKSSSGKLDIVDKLLDLERSKPQWTEDWTKSMMLTNFGAGVETTGAVMSEVVVQAIAHPSIQLKIHEEVGKALKEGRITDPIGLGQIQRELPYLQACIDEAFRFHGVIGVMMPRVVPVGGVTIDGYFIPAGTTIGINPWVISRDKSLYGEDAEKFRPERWLEMSNDEKTRLDKYSMRFGTGARSCPGQYLAIAIMAKVLPAMFSHFEWSFTDPAAKRRLETTFIPRYVNVMVTWKPRDAKEDTK